MAIAHGQHVLQAGEPLGSAHAAMILLHGRGATAEDIMTIASEVQAPGWIYFAPQAAGFAWYPNPFTAPIENNEPYLSAALHMIANLLERIEAQIPLRRVVLLGFSQGACLALEFAARNVRTYGGVIGLSGGLIGPDPKASDYSGDFEATPVLLGCSDVDPHISKERVVQTGEIFEKLGANVTMHLYPGMAHTVSLEEIEEIRALVAAI